MRLTISMLVVISAASAVRAELQVTERWSEVNASYLCGYGPDVYSGGDTDSDGNLLAIDGVTLSGSATEQDEYLGHFWTATFVWDVAHDYAISGGLDSAYLITSSGATTTSADVVDATGTLSSAAPGNELTLTFEVPADQDFWLRGSIAQTGPLNRNKATVEIHRWWEPTGYQAYIVRTLQNSSFNDLITLPAGTYQIIGQAVSRASQVETAGASWDYELEAVAAPGALGDMNCDGQVDFGDINPFVLYLSNFATWQATYVDCPPANGDINQDGVYPGFGDINPFVALLTSQR